MEQAAALLALLNEEDGMSIHKACKKLALSMSEMMRLLTALGSAETGGLDLVERRDEAGRTCLYMTQTARMTTQAAIKARDEAGNALD